jgi:HEAT repeat protein
MKTFIAIVASTIPAATAFASPDANAQIARFQAEQVFWKQADIADEIAPLVKLRDLEPLMTWLKHDDRHVRGNTAYLFARLGDRRGLDTLFAILADRSGQRTIQPPVIETGPVEELGPGRTDPRDAWRRSPEALRQQITIDRYYAVHLLGRLRDPRAVDVLVPLLDDDDIDYNVAWALGEIGDARAIPALIKALSDKTPLVRVAAIGALETMHATQALPQITALFEDMAIPQAGRQVTVGSTARQAADSLRRQPVH